MTCQNSDGNEEVLRIPPNSNITGTSPSESLMSYQGYPLGEVLYSSAEKPSTGQMDSEIQIDYQISAKRPDLVIVKPKKEVGGRGPAE